MISKTIQHSLDRYKADAKRFGSLDMGKCQLCEAAGPDMRSLFVGCGYAVHEVVEESICLSGIESLHDRGHFLRICKTCRGRLLEHMRVWAEECRAMRGIPKDSDGSPVEQDPERNIPVRVHGAVVMMTRKEYEATSEFARKKEQ